MPAPRIYHMVEHTDGMPSKAIINQSSNNNLICNTCYSSTISSATRGHSLKLAKKQSNSNLRLYRFSIRVINNWNNLSNHVV